MGKARKQKRTKATRPPKKIAGSDYASAHNLVDLLEHLDRGGKVSVNSIRKKCGVGHGAAKNYLKFLKARRNIRDTMQGTEKFWSLAAGGPKTRSFDEVAALELSVRSAPWLEGTPYHGLLFDQVNACRELVPPDQQDRLYTYVRSFCHRTQGDASYSTKKTELERLLRAIRERRRCEFEYERHDGAISTYHVEPLLLVLYKDRLYLSARKAREQARRTFCLESISAVRVDHEAPQFSIADARFTEPEQVFRHSFGVFTDSGAPVDVELEVRGSAAMTLKRRKMHSTQQLEPIADGWYRARWTVAQCAELRSFILSLLPNVRVRAPDDLREQLAAAARAFIAPVVD